MEEEKKATKNLEKATLFVISSLLTDLCDESSKKPELYNLPKSKPFISKTIPSISIEQYLERLYKYSKVEQSTLVLILIYIDRVCNFNKISLNYYNIHKLILTSLMVAIKYNEDDYYGNDFYAKVGGVTKNEIKFLEFEFLLRIKFNLYVDEEVFNKYNDYIISAQDEIEESEMIDDETNYESNSNTNVYE